MKIQKDFDGILFLLTPEQAIYLLSCLSCSKNTCSSDRTYKGLSLEREFLISTARKDWRGGREGNNIQ